MYGYYKEIYNNGWFSHDTKTIDNPKDSPNHVDHPEFGHVFN
jgi:hypothetical protein